MSRKDSLGADIRKLRAGLGYRTQADFAKLFGVGQAAFSAWERDDPGRKPPLGVFLKLASLSRTAEEAKRFLAHGGIDRSLILEIAERVFQKRLEPPPPGENVRIPQLRPTDQGLEDLGEDISLPSRVIPNPGSTISLLIDEKASGVVSGPQGLYLVEKPAVAATRLEDLEGRVVVLSFVPHGEFASAPAGIYVGRLRAQQDAWGPRGEVVLYCHWSLEFLTDRKDEIDIYGGKAPLPFKFTPKEVPRGIFDFRQLETILKYRSRDLEALYKASADLASSARLPAGSELIGEVIGRLTGHIKRGRSQGKK